ncbi:MAG: nucleotidyltransferase domain-containing protein [Clostridium sp.]
MKKIKLSELKNIEYRNIIGLAIFGSFNTEYFRENRSDIDVLVLLEYSDDVIEDFDIEDYLIPILEEHFEYDKIHLTFLTMKEYDTVFARQYLESEDKLILDKFKELDFRMYVNKYRRNNEK